MNKSKFDSFIESCQQSLLDLREHDYNEHETVVDNRTDDHLSIISDLDDDIFNSNYNMSIAHCIPNGRTKLFNSLFTVWKRKHINSTIQSYKCGQIVDVHVSFVDDSRRFYVIEQARLNDLNYLENCIQNYANVLLTDDTIANELFSFQMNTHLYDVVLVYVKKLGKWRRAVLVEKLTSNDFAYDDDDEDVDEQMSQSAEQKFYLSFFLIDWGMEELVIVPKNQFNTHLFVLPMNEKLIQIGAFALKCTLSQAQLRIRDKYASMKPFEGDLFERRFNELLREKSLRMRISQTVCIRAEFEAIVELFFMPAQIGSLIDLLVDKFKHSSTPGVEQSLHETVADLRSKQALNCINYILSEIELGLKERNHENKVLWESDEK